MESRETVYLVNHADRVRRISKVEMKHNEITMSVEGLQGRVTTKRGKEVRVQTGRIICKLTVGSVEP